MVLVWLVYFRDLVKGRSLLFLNYNRNQADTAFASSLALACSMYGLLSLTMLRLEQ